MSSLLWNITSALTDRRDMWSILMITKTWLPCAFDVSPRKPQNQNNKRSFLLASEHQKYPNSGIIFKEFFSSSFKNHASVIIEEHLCWGTMWVGLLWSTSFKGLVGGVATAQSTEYRVNWTMVDRSTNIRVFLLSMPSWVVLGHLHVLVGPGYAQC